MQKDSVQFSLAKYWAILILTLHVGVWLARGMGMGPHALSELTGLNCLWHDLFSISCPTCGLLRSWFACIQGDMSLAAHFHFFGVPSYFLIIGMSLKHILNSWPQTRFFHPITTGLFVILFLTWGIWRNYLFI